MKKQPTVSRDADAILKDMSEELARSASAHAAFVAKQLSKTRGRRDFGTAAAAAGVVAAAGTQFAHAHQLECRLHHSNPPIPMLCSWSHRRPPQSRHRRAAGAFEAACANMVTAKRAAEEALVTYSEAETKRQRAAE